MKHNILKSILFFCLVPSLVQAEGVTYLNFTVSNLSNTPVSFKSTDIFDFGKIVRKNEKKTITYDYPPKIIVFKIHAKTQGPFDLITDPNCDILGLPDLRQPTPVIKGKDVTGMSAYKAGEVHVTITETPDSTESVTHLSCVKSQKCNLLN